MPVHSSPHQHVSDKTWQMPRIPPWLFRHARKASPDLATLLPACRDLQSARNELRWIRDHANETARTGVPNLVSDLCRRRGRGEPLQYVLGTQPFSSLDIKCRPGVLIPRPETEAYACHLVELIKSGVLVGRKSRCQSDEVNIIDFCTGTGCIPLLLFSSLQPWVKKLNVRGMDISPRAVRLANENIACNTEAGLLPEPADGQSLKILKGDIFDDQKIHSLTSSKWDIMVSNPPYISRDVWNHGRGQLGFSVRKFEPRLALVPNDVLNVPAGWLHEDLFYARLLELAERLRPRALLLEIGDEDQARRVLVHLFGSTMAKSSHIEIWRDWPDVKASDGEMDVLHVEALDGQHWDVPTKGSGNVRAILVRCHVDK